MAHSCRVKVGMSSSWEAAECHLCLDSRPIWKPLMEVAASCVPSMRSTGGVHGQLARTIQCGHPMSTQIEPFVLP